MVVFLQRVIFFFVTQYNMERGLKIAAVIALVAYFVGGGMRMALIMGGTAFGADMLL